MTGFTCQLNGPISCVHRLRFKPFHEGLHIYWGFNVSKKFPLLNEVKMPRTSLVIGSTRIINMVSSDGENGSPCKEEEDEEMGNDESGQRAPILPPWGVSEIRLDSDFEPNGGLGRPKIGTEKTAMLNLDSDSSVHFLEESDEEVLSNRVLVLSRTNKARSALELLRSMEFSGLRANSHACNSLLSCLFRNGFVEDAIRVFEFMKAKKIASGHAFSLVLKGVSQARGCEAALEMYSQMESQSQAEGRFDTVVYNTMISVCGRANNWREALRFWKAMKVHGLAETRVTFSVLVCTFVRCGQNELALEAYNKMVRSKFELGNDTMQAMIGACAKEGKWGLALSVFKSMLKRGFKPNAIACNAVINSLGKAGEIKLASGVFKLMKSLGHSPDSYTGNALLGALNRANRPDDALNLFNSIKQEQDLELNLHLYNTALLSCSKLGFWDRALQLLWQMEAEGLTASTASYNLAIAACERARKPDIALQVYKHMAHQKCDPDTFTHLLLIRVCIWGSLWHIVEEILNATPDASLYNAAIQGMCLRGMVVLAKKLYAKMREFGLKPDGKTRALMLQNLRRNPGKHKV